MQRLARLPIILQLAFLGAIAMLVPAIHAAVTLNWPLARIFVQSAVGGAVVTVLIGLALLGRPAADRVRGVLPTMLGVFAVLPVLLAIPMAAALPDTGLFNAWWEMLSCLTTTGATLYAPDLLDPSLHLWRALVGWLGGLFVLVAAVALLAPLHVGGFEIVVDTEPAPAVGPGGRTRTERQARPDSRIRRISADPAFRMWRSGAAVAPPYAGLTLALWLGLMLTGDSGLVALCRAMGTLSTSGISPVGGPVGAPSGGVPAEALIALFLLTALSRRMWPGGNELRTTRRLRRDPELRMAAALVAMVTLVLVIRPMLGVLGAADPVSTPEPAASGLVGGLARSLAAAWGTAFSALSFLTTTGWTSVHWEGARAWSGLSAPGLMLAGLAIMGGGVATTAGGVKLLRVYALARHSQRELERIVHPASVGGGGTRERQLREGGAYLAFIFFMLFAMSIALVVVMVSIRPIAIETATMLSVAALTNTGPLAEAIPLIPAYQGSAGSAGAPWAGWAGLSVFTKSVLAGAMVAGRIETLAILAMFAPGLWRR
ncbi:potassium transporter TrkG [uncultured Paracoccus sp.]|uniref:potassium transporter TrkG n=1 Tax=uncultured Paracoccus sp. TaxID=189685 RepID=UPI00260A4B3B|nr:potassium transporter TrkG [uncultured Paracoccus sp.]